MFRRKNDTIIVENAVDSNLRESRQPKAKVVSLRMQQLNFPTYEFRYKNSDGRISIYDVIRKKFVVLTPEEWVRQHVVQFLLQQKKYPKSLINVEKLLKINDRIKRYDVVVFNNDGTILILIECKAPEIKITQHTFDQIARYNLTMQSELLMVTNGLSHFFCKMDYAAEKYDFLTDIPDYSTAVTV